MPSRSAFRPAAVAACLLITAVLSAQARRTITPRPAFAEPSIAPDGSEIAFVSGGDIWTVPAAGGQARLLISHAANETRPVYSPDKSQLAFVSTRTGGGDVYVLTLASGDVRRVTFDDGLEQLDGWSRDGNLNMTLRGTPTAPARSVLGQRSLEKPTILVTNQHSLSGAEDFTEGYRALGLGKVVGEPTAGWIISTWNTRLLDGTILRLPRMRITDRNGADMEMHPRPVDVEVKRPIGESYGGKDSQLDKAVELLLRQIGGAS